MFMLLAAVYIESVWYLQPCLHVLKMSSLFYMHAVYLFADIILAVTDTVHPTHADYETNLRHTVHLLCLIIHHGYGNITSIWRLDSVLLLGDATSHSPYL
jgi:hypothetical protein